MADERAESREVSWRSLLPWTELFRGFKIALDLNKLLLAAAGLVLTALGYTILAWVFGTFFSNTPPQWNGAPNETEKWKTFKADRDEWNLMHKSAGIGDPKARYEALDLAQTSAEIDQINIAEDDYKNHKGDRVSLLEMRGFDRTRAEYISRDLGRVKPSGLMNTWPWNENRGPNPFLLATGQVPHAWEPGRFWEWFTFDQAPVLIEPLIKMLRPIVFFFSPNATGLMRFYFFCVLLWTIAVWSLFGGAITRIAAVQVARNERIGMSEAVRFTMKRLMYYVTAPLFPLVFVFGLLIVMIIFGFFSMIPIFGDIFVSGLFWWLIIGLGLLMAVALVGLVGWPLMAATISAEGTDSWEAVSRSYTYVFQRPWQYLWYSIVAVCYGAAVVFFIGFMGSFMVYLSKWGVAHTPFIGPQYTNREPSYLFAYAPTSFGWRTLLLNNVVVDGQKLVQDGEIKKDVYDKFVGRDETYRDKPDEMSWWNKVGAGLVAIWVGLVFLLVVGFGYSFFWSASTIIYLLMRRSVDTAELDEVYLEEDDQDGAYAGTLGPQPSAPVETPPAKPGTQSLQLVEAPASNTPEPVVTTTESAPTETPGAATPSPNGGGGPAPGG